LRPLADNPEFIAIAEKIATYRARQADAKTRFERARHASSLPKPTRTPQERAELLARGGTIPSADPQSEMKAAEEEQRILASAICELKIAQDEIASRASYEASMQFRDRHIAALRQLDAALASTHAAIVELVHIDQRLREAGYVPNSSALPTHLPPSAWRTGDPDRAGTEAWGLRQWLRQTFGEGR
jgi:hypothetical protein